jgi:hypothetical protein
MAQPIIAERALSDELLSGQGFLARCLLSWPESKAGTRVYCPENLRQDAAMIRYDAKLDALLHRPLPIAGSRRNELAPPALNLSPEAVLAWHRVHNVIERSMAPGARFATAKPWASKAPEQCLRIAGVLTLVDNPGASTIDASTLDRAAELTLWHLNEAARLAGTAELSSEVRDAEALLDWCHTTGRSFLHSRDALNKGPSRIRERARFMQAVAELERAGWTERIAGGAELDGAHRRNVWRIAPAIAGL